MLEQGRQDIAAREWNLLAPADGGSTMDRELALRAPQRAAAEARVAAAEARVKQAQINLDRTTIKAPFDATILSRHANIGDQATPQMVLAELANTGICHIRAALPVSDVKHVKRPTAGQTGARATATWPDGTARTGSVIALLGELDPKGSMAQLLIEVPIEIDAEALYGSYVTIIFDGKELPPAYILPRNALAGAETALLLTSSNTLHMVDVTPLWEDRDMVVSDLDLHAGDKLITSTLSSPVEGMSLRTPNRANKQSEAPSTGEKR
jgi:multidrug efflux pump subunit AcrA (membrane-fusion protein)